MDNWNRDKLKSVTRQEAVTRLNILRTRTRLLCLSNPEHGVQEVEDVFSCNPKTAKLACGCRRPLFVELTNDERVGLAAYLLEEEKRELERLRREQEMEALEAA